MKMTVHERDDDISHVVLVGRLDATAEEEISADFAQATAARERPAIVDITGVDFLASLGIRLLVINAKRLMKSGHKMVLLNPQALVESVLKTSRLESMMPIVHALDEAVRILGGKPSGAEPKRTPPMTDAVEARNRRPESISQAAATSDGQLKLTIKNEISELEGVNAALAKFLAEHGVFDKAAYAVNLAVEELVVNVISYAYVDEDTHPIEMEIVIKGNQIILSIVDDGRPFDPRSGPALDLHAEDRDVGGLGLLLVLDMVDVLTYRRVNEKNCVEVRIHTIAENGQAENGQAENGQGELSEVRSDSADGSDR